MTPLHIIRLVQIKQIFCVMPYCELSHAIISSCEEPTQQLSADPSLLSKGVCYMTWKNMDT